MYMEQIYWVASGLAGRMLGRGYTWVVGISMGKGNMANSYSVKSLLHVSYSVKQPLRDCGCSQSLYYVVAYDSLQETLPAILLYLLTMDPLPPEGRLGGALGSLGPDEGFPGCRH